MSIINFWFTGTADRLRITVEGTDDNNHAIGKQYSCYLAPFPGELTKTIESEQQAYINWLNGVIPLALTQSPINMQTNNSSFTECEQFGEQKTRLFEQWISSPPPLKDPNAPLLPNSNSLQGNLPNILSHADYNKNRNNHSFIIHTDTEDPELNLKLQRLPFHTWGLIANYPNAEVAFSMIQHPPVSQPSSDRLRVFVILGDDAAINLEPHEQAIHNFLSTFADVRDLRSNKIPVREG